MLRRINLLLPVVLFFMAGGAWADSVISVKGQGEVKFEPNLVTFGVELWARGKTANEVQKATLKYQADIEKVFSQYKLGKKDYQTVEYNFSPEYEYDQSLKKNRMVGFGITHRYNVILKDTKAVGPMIDELLSLKMSNNAGVNVNSIQWDSSERNKYLLQALSKAVEDAGEKAEQIAKAAKLKIKKIENISYGSMGAPRLNAKSRMGLMAASAETTLAEGQISEAVEVTVDYSF